MLLIGCAAAAAVVAAAAQAESRADWGGSARLSCRVSGDPVDFPDDLWVVNQGPSALPSGSRVAWTVLGRQGEHTLRKALRPGKGVRIPRAIPGGISPMQPCAASVRIASRGW